MSCAAALTELILETFRLNGRLLAAGDALVRDLGLTSARWQVLGAAAMAPAPLSVAQIARTMGLSRQGVQRIVNELQKQGIVRLAPNPHHQRAKLVLPTERGRGLFAAATARQRPWAEALAGGLDRREVDAALGVVRRVRARLEAEADGAEDGAPPEKGQAAADGAARPETRRST
jgi:DNA-binding MarR family transcriptional regulator